MIFLFLNVFMQCVKAVLQAIYTFIKVVYANIDLI